MTITDTNDIESIVVEYNRNQSTSSPPDSGWSTERPTWAQGYYIWQRTRIHKSGTSETDDSFGKPVCITGSTGQTGASGRSLTNTITHFTVAASNITIDESNMSNYTWISNTPAYNSSTPTYWVRVTNTYSNPSSTEYIFYKDQGLTDANATAATANTTANNAAAVASSAITTANSAAAAAASASALAGSKNTVYYASTSSALPSSVKNGDIWIQIQSSEGTNDGIAGSRIMRLYENNQWNQIKFGTDSLVAGTVVADLIAGNAITAAQISAHTITVDELDMNNINASQSITVGAFNTSLTNSLASNEQLIYIQATSAASSPSAFPPSATSSSSYWITNSGESVVGTALPTWTLKHPTYSSVYPVTYVAKQKISVDGIISCTTPLKDDSTTVIDGGHITTGSINANLITTNKIQGTQIAVDTIDVQDLNLYGELTFHKNKTTTDTGGALGYTDGIDWFQPQDIVRQMSFELGAIDNTNGTEVTNTKAIRTSGYFNISGNTSCTLYCDSLVFSRMFSSITIMEYSGSSSNSFIQYKSFNNNNSSRMKNMINNIKFCFMY